MRSTRMIVLSFACLLGGTGFSLPGLAPSSAAGKPAGGAARSSETRAFDGSRAYRDLKRLVAFGPRPAGSPALAHARGWIVDQLQRDGCQVDQDRFTASTPAGDVPMTNLIVRIPGKGSKVVIVSGHYDTKRFSQFKFVGANDGGSSAALLLELARSECHRKRSFATWLVFFDGEEAVRQWSGTDGTYGSRHLVAKLTADGEISRVGAMILVDMIGDAHLDIKRDTNSTPWLTDLVFGAARRLGYGRHFLDEPLAAQDDHIPFVNAGVPAADLIDFDYGPDNTYWHTAEDIPAHCSPQSLAIVGRVVLATLDEVEHSLKLE